MALGIIVLALFLIRVYIHLAYLPLRPGDDGFEYVCVEEDGSVRELDKEEVAYLSTEFSPTDSGRPYIKEWYRSKTPDNKISGFIRRERVPGRFEIKSVDQTR